MSDPESSTPCARMVRDVINPQSSRYSASRLPVRDWTYPSSQSLSEQWVWTWQPQRRASSPRFRSNGSVQLGANRGVTTGCTRPAAFAGWPRTYSIRASVPSSAAAAEGSRRP